MHRSGARYRKRALVSGFEITSEKGHLPIVLRHIRYGLRGLARTPGFTVAAIVTMMLGIGANVAVFTVLNTALLRPLPYRQPDRVVIIWETKKLFKSDRITVAAPNYRDWRDENHVFDGMSLIKGAAFHLIRSGESRDVQGLSVTADYFRLLGASPKVGRTFTPEEERCVSIDLRHSQTEFTDFYSLRVCGSSLKCPAIWPKVDC